MKQLCKKGLVVLTALVLGVALVGCHASYSGSIASTSSVSSSK